MSALERVRANRSALVARWADLIFATYPEQGAVFLRNEKDPFKNPIGSAVRRELAVLVDWLAGDGEVAEVLSAVDKLVRIRAVQDFTPAQAVGFVFLAKRALRELMEAEGAAAADELSALFARVDDLVLKAFDAYTTARERIAEIRVRQALARTHSLLRRAGAVDLDDTDSETLPAGEGESRGTKGGS